MKIDLDELLSKPFNKIVLADPEKDAPYKKIVVKRLSGGKTLYQAEKFTKTQAFHENFDDLKSFVTANISFYRNLYAWGDESFSATVRKGIVVACKKVANVETNPQTHNRTKNYPIPEGSDMPIFYKLGIFTKDNKVVQSMQDKFKQINRYIEMLSDVLHDYKEGDEIYVVDYCSGKSYLSFAVYHYLQNVKKLKVTLDGIDLKADVIKKCSDLAKEYGYDGMSFYAMDIKEFKPKKDIDLTISLHACDVATDYVLYSAVKSNAKRIFAVPCCQHECAKSINTAYEPLLTNYGILTERLSAMITDSVRCALLELNGYKTELLEFVDLTDSPKNLLIRAVKTHRPKAFLEMKKAELNDLLTRTGARLTAVELLTPKDE